MRRYELMVILDPDLEERTVAPSLETYLKIIKESGGRVDKLDIWGKRRMAFEIAKKSEGIYAVVDMHCEPAAIKELDRQLNLNEAVLRTKVVLVALIFPRTTIAPALNPLPVILIYPPLDPALPPP